MFCLHLTYIQASPFVAEAMLAAGYKGIKPQHATDVPSAPVAGISRTKMKRASITLESQLNARPLHDLLQSRGIVADADGSLPAGARPKIDT